MTEVWALPLKPELRAHGCARGAGLVTRVGNCEPSGDPSHWPSELLVIRVTIRVTVRWLCSGVPGMRPGGMPIAAE